MKLLKEVAAALEDAEKATANDEQRDGTEAQGAP